MLSTLVVPTLRNFTRARLPKNLGVHETGRPRAIDPEPWTSAMLARSSETRNPFLSHQIPDTFIRIAASICYAHRGSNLGELMYEGSDTFKYTYQDLVQCVVQGRDDMASQPIPEPHKSQDLGSPYCADPNCKVLQGLVPGPRAAEKRRAPTCFLRHNWGPCHFIIQTVRSENHQHCLGI